MWKYCIDSGVCLFNLNNSRIFEENAQKMPHALGLGNHTARLARHNQKCETSWGLFLFPI